MRKLKIVLTPKSGNLSQLYARVNGTKRIDTQGGAGEWEGSVHTDPTTIDLKARGSKGSTYEYVVEVNDKQKNKATPRVPGNGTHRKTLGNV